MSRNLYAVVVGRAFRAPTSVTSTHWSLAAARAYAKLVIDNPEVGETAVTVVKVPVPEKSSKLWKKVKRAA